LASISGCSKLEVYLPKINSGTISLKGLSPPMYRDVRALLFQYREQPVSSGFRVEHQLCGTKFAGQVSDMNTLLDEVMSLVPDCCCGGVVNFA